MLQTNNNRSLIQIHKHLTLDSEPDMVTVVFRNYNKCIKVKYHKNSIQAKFWKNIEKGNFMLNSNILYECNSTITANNKKRELKEKEIFEWFNKYLHGNVKITKQSPKHHGFLRSVLLKVGIRL